MQHENDFLIEEFEKEVWLYLDNNLPEKRLNYWRNHLASNPALKQWLDEIQLLLTTYDELVVDDINENSFNQMINNAVNKKTLFSRIKSLFKTESSSGGFIPKIAFGSFLVIASLIILLLSEKPNPVNKISAELLDWDDKSTSVQINNISTALSLIENNNLKEYLLYKKTRDKWSRDIYTLEKQIKNLNSEIEEKSL